MQDDHGRMINEMNRSSHEKSIWKRIITVLACVVVFGTTYALILPAITMDAKKTLVCTEETASGHVHSKECKAQDGETLTCGYADYVIHTHDEKCYDSEGNLICGFNEVKEHRHTEECYKENQEGSKELICSEPEVIYHEHNENCFDENGTLICKEQQVLKHQHTDQCFVTENEEAKESQKTEEVKQAETEEPTQQEKEEGKEPETEETATSGEEEKPEVKEPESETTENQETENKEAENKTSDVKSEETKNEETKNPQISKEEEKEELENKDSQKDKTTDTSGTEEKEAQRKHKMTHKGKDYTVRVTFDEEAQLPSGVELKVEEIKPESTEYQDYYKQAEEALPEDQGLMFCRFFDVSFVADGKKVEPKASVDVEISYEDSVPQQKGVETNAIHFAEDGIEVIPAEVGENAKGEDTFTFTQNSFSVVGTAVSAIDLSDGSYIFYRDGYALGYIGGNVGAVAVTVDENGYVYPKDSTYTIDGITWTYSNECLINKYVASSSNKKDKYLSLSNGQVQSSEYAQRLQARVINNTIRILYEDIDYSTGEKGYYLGFNQKDKKFTSIRKFSDGDYLFGAKVANVKETEIQPGDLEVEDQIKDQGVLKPEMHDISFSGEKLAYIWYRSDDGKNGWTEVERKKITGNSYNVAEDGSWLNVPLDGGADKYYKVVLMSVDGKQQITTIESKPYHVPYYDQVQNGDFEEPVISIDVDDAEHYQPFLPNGTAGMVWKTTASDGEIEFISVASEAFKEMSDTWHRVPEAAKGEQFVELNANMPGALYQDVLTIPGSTMYWSLAHRGRGWDKNTETQYGTTLSSTDTMYVLAMSTQLAEEKQIITQNDVEYVMEHLNQYPGATIKEISDDNSKWVYHNGVYEVPENQYLTRYFFVAGDTAYEGNLNGTIGNHLDDIHFSTELPPPETGKVNLEVNKTIVGLNETEAKTLLEKLQFTTDGAIVSGSDFKNFKQNEDGSYTASYQIQIDIGSSKQVTKSVSENLSTADISGYKRTGTTYTTGENGRSNIYDGSSINIRIADQDTGTVSFTNTYAPETVNMSILKLNDEETPEALFGAVFSLEAQGGTGWKTVGDNISVDNNGLAEIKDLSYKTLYRLTETKAPDGYSMLTEKIYFKILKDDDSTSVLVPCKETGDELKKWPGQIEVQSSNMLQLRIINNKKAVLPETGGSGTNWIYIMGTIFVLTGTILYGCQRKRRLERRNRL